MRVGEAKKVVTYDCEGAQNGYIIELGKDGKKTTSYLTVALPGCTKGFHMHVVRASNYVCIRGKVKVTLAVPGKGFDDYTLDASKPERLHIPIYRPTLITNEWDEEGWLINVPEPAYDPDLKDEQIDMTWEEAQDWLAEHDDPPDAGYEDHDCDSFGVNAASAYRFLRQVSKRTGEKTEE